ncbi:MAG: hypothetical protein HKN48_02760 [Flavobacteriaceae bacterium]|nr:hypothetical protein [Flavobacteriaceae bacterium]
MRNLWMLGLLFFGISMYAQPGNPDRPEPEQIKKLMKDLSTEQKATLMTKRMTLDLNLSEAQQSQIFEINKDVATQREARFKERENTKLTSDDFFQYRSQLLDEKIATKKRFQAVLNKDQFEKFERSQHRKIAHRRPEHTRKKR